MAALRKCEGRFPVILNRNELIAVFKDFEHGGKTDVCIYNLSTAKALSHDSARFTRLENWLRDIGWQPDVRYRLSSDGEASLRLVNPEPIRDAGFTVREGTVPGW